MRHRNEKRSTQTSIRTDTRGGIRRMALVGTKTGLEWTYQPSQPIQHSNLVRTIIIFLPLVSQSIPLQFSLHRCSIARHSHTVTPLPDTAIRHPRRRDQSSPLSAIDYRRSTIDCRNYIYDNMISHHPVPWQLAVLRKKPKRSRVPGDGHAPAHTSVPFLMNWIHCLTFSYASP